MTEQERTLLLAVSRWAQEQYSPTHRNRRDTQSDLENDLDEALAALNEMTLVEQLRAVPHVVDVVLTCAGAADEIELLRQALSELLADIDDPELIEISAATITRARQALTGRERQSR
jgi:crotonobetainyl-CoA:carnitine CoA-transferase CaiB-like acyl-CoA transferase